MESKTYIWYRWLTCRPLLYIWAANKAVPSFWAQTLWSLLGAGHQISSGVPLWLGTLRLSFLHTTVRGRGWSTKQNNTCHRAPTGRSWPTTHWQGHSNLWDPGDHTLNCQTLQFNACRRKDRKEFHKYFKGSSSDFYTASSWSWNCTK